MEKEILIQNLRTKLGADKAGAISDRTFDAFATDWLPQFSDDSKITEDTWKFPLTVLTNYAGQKLHDDAEMSAKFKKEYEDSLASKIEEAKKAAIAEYLKNNPAPTPPKPNENNGDNGNKKMEDLIAEQISAAIGNLTKEDGVIGKLTTSMTDFLNKTKEQERAAMVKTLKSQLSEHLKGKGANSAAVIDDAINELEYGENPDFNDLKTKAENAYETRFKRYYGNGGKPWGSKRPTGNPSEDGLSDDIKSYIEANKKKAEQSANYQQELSKTFM